MNIIHYPDPKLLAKTEPVATVTSEIRDKIREMFRLMYAEQGVGLAAPQVGWSVRIFVMNATGKTDQPESERVFINPKIKKRRGRVVGPEGCLSFPDVLVDVERAKSVAVEYLDDAGEAMQQSLEEFEARIFQHELDHLDNILLVHRMSEADKIRNRDSLEQLKRAYEPIG